MRYAGRLRAAWRRSGEPAQRLPAGGVGRPRRDPGTGDPAVADGVVLLGPGPGAGRRVLPHAIDGHGPTLGGLRHRWVYQVGGAWRGGAGIWGAVVVEDHGGRSGAWMDVFVRVDGSPAESHKDTVLCMLNL